MRIIFIFTIYFVLHHQATTEAFNLFNKATNLNCNRASSSKILMLSKPLTGAIPTDCLYTIKAHSSHVCQLRLDFDIDLMPPTTTNTLGYPECSDEFMSVGDFKLCGIDRNQHLYVPFNRTAGVKEIPLRIVTSSSATAAPSWKIKVTQLECSMGSPLRTLFNSVIQPRTFFQDGYLIAPNGCSQYYPDNSGTITSFNYQNGRGLYPGQMTYAICFRRSTSKTTLHLTATHFQLGHEASDSQQLDENCVPHVSTPGRSEDFLLIPGGAIPEQNLRATYFCGNILDKTTVISMTPGPLYMIFNSDDIYTEAIPETGFSFQYNLD